MTPGELKIWLLDHRLIKISRLEEEAGIPHDTLRNTIEGKREIPIKHIKAIKSVLKAYGLN